LERLELRPNVPQKRHRRWRKRIYEERRQLIQTGQVGRINNVSVDAWSVFNSEQTCRRSGAVGGASELLKSVAR